ncbi:hypothetical protein M9H77_17637 [Catharanthus roseus]|uniref:Uncharacterized protein n=1 Tax=Catharanthus roseus TaxID=4058 RepID=A0ACC0B561_CATRO|nr:hypothetical protein M9H77_17637 [Catharanthus roseus]
MTISSKGKLEVADFYKDGHVDMFLDWIHSLDSYFRWHNMNEVRKLFFVEAKLKGTSCVWCIREQAYVGRTATCDFEWNEDPMIEIYREGLKPQISLRLVAVIFYPLSDAIQVATQIVEDILARSSHKVAALNNRQVDKFNAENSYNGEAKNSQSYPTQTKGQFSHTSQGGQQNQKWQRRPNRNLCECHYCGQARHLMAFCPNKKN